MKVKAVFLSCLIFANITNLYSNTRQALLTHTKEAIYPAGCIALAVSAITACYISGFTACLFYDMMKKNKEITITRTVKEVVTPSVISAVMLYVSVKSSKEALRLAFNSFFR